MNGKGEANSGLKAIFIGDETDLQDLTVTIYTTQRPEVPSRLRLQVCTCHNPLLPEHSTLFKLKFPLIFQAHLPSERAPQNCFTACPVSPFEVQLSQLFPQHPQAICL